MAKVKSAKTKSFKDLIYEVQVYEFCGKCGGCVSFCSAGNLLALKIDENGFPVFADEEKCVHCGICYMICPNTNELESELKKKFNWKAPWGPVKAITSAKTTDSTVEKDCTDGGVVTSLLLYLFDKGLIEGALVSKSKGPFQRGPLMATSREEIISAAGSHFDESLSILELGSQYSTYSPNIYALKQLTEGTLDKVAMVGTPCQIRTVRKMQLLEIIPADIINYVFGLFCWENFSFNDLEKNQLAQRYDFDLDEVVKVNIKEELCIYLRDGRLVKIPLDLVDFIARPACLVCPDFSSEYADLSFGGLGSSDSYTTVVIRSETGRKVYKDALAAGYVKEKKHKSLQKAKSELSDIKTLIDNFSKRKKSRARQNRRIANVKLNVPPVREL